MTDADGNSVQQRRAVVIIDDDPALLHSLTFALELEGYAVTPYRDAAETLSAAELPPAGCMVVDYVLPDMDGIELIAALRARGVAMPAILITSHPGPELLRRALTVGTRVIEKPLLTDTLSEAIASSFPAGQ